MNEEADQAVDLTSEERAINRDAQENELLALEAIFDKNFIYERTEGNFIRGSLSIPLALESEVALPVLSVLDPSPPKPSLVSITSNQPSKVQHLPPITIKFHLQPGYPSRDPPNFALDCTWLHQSRKERLRQKLMDIWEDEKDVALYNFAEFISNDLVSFLELLVPSDIRTDSAPLLQIFPPSIQPDADELLLIVDAILEWDRKAVQAEFDVSTYDCGICIETRLGEDCFRFGVCGHVFCRNCLRDYFSLLITEGTVNQVHCPDTICKKNSKPSAITSTDLGTIVGPSLAARYNHLVQKNLLESNPQVTYCPRPQCQTPLIRPSQSTKLCVCPSCSFAFCYFCNRCWHGAAQACAASNLMKIAQNWLDSDEKGRAELEMRYGKKTVGRLVEEFESERETLEWKRNNTTGCPTCEISVVKSDGCNHMTCSCGTHFCYLCGAYLDKRRPYVHFNQLGSPCYGRLFEGALPGGRNPGDLEFDEDVEVMNDDALMRWALREEGDD